MAEALSAPASSALGIGTDPFASGIKRMGELGGERKAVQETFDKQSTGLQEKIGTERQAANDLQPPKMDDLGAKFEHQGLDPKQMQEASQTMFALAAIGGLMTRAPMTAALNGFAGALKGLHDGDAELFKRESTTFQTNLKQAIAKNAAAMQEYQAAFQKHKGNMADLMNEWNIIAKKHGDTVSAINMERQDIQGMLKQIESMKKIDEQSRKTDQQFSIQMRKIDEQMRRTDVLAEERGLDRESRERMAGDRNKIAEDKLRASVAKGPQATQRAQLVVSSAKNTLNRLDELTQGKEETPKASLMFGAHPDGIMGRAGTAVGNKMIGEDQRKIDAAYSAIIDEAIPVFTGGLRGSDSYRKFLISQMPGQGDDNASATEKLRLFRANTQGNLDTFAGAFKSNPAFHAEGEAVGAPKAGGASGGWSDDKEKRYQELKAKQSAAQ